MTSRRQRLHLQLRYALPLAHLVLTAGAAFIITWVNVEAEERAVEEQEIRQLTNDLTARQQTLEFLLVRGEHEQAQQELAAEGAQPNHVVAVVTDERDTVIASSRRVLLDQPWATVEDALGYSLDLPDGIRARARRRHLGEVSLTSGGEAVVGVYPVVLGISAGKLRPDRIGLLTMRRSLGYRKGLAQHRALTEAAQLAGAVALIAGGLALISHFMVTRRLHRVVEATEHFARGDMRARARLRGYDELATVAAAFDAMADQVASAQQRLREQTQHMLSAQKLESVGRLAGGIAHDFNNRLTAILAYAAALETQLAAEPVLLADVQEIITSAERASELTQQLLAFARRQHATPRILDVAEQVRATENLLRRLVGEDVTVSTVLPDASCTVRIDPGQLEQVLVNLAVNARDAMPRGGELRLELEPTTRGDEHDDGLPAGAYVRLRVSDTGHGMTSDVLARAFEPFFTTKEVGRGTGLGLASCYGIVTQAGGRISLSSQVGGGTTFEILLPRVSEPLWAPAPRPSRRGQRGNETILVVEDEPTLRRVVLRLLDEHGYRTLAAASGPDALEMAERFVGHIDLLVTDVVMPGGMRGPELAARLVDARADLRVLYMSGYAEEALTLVDQRPGTSFLAKPFSPNAFIERVRDVLDAQVELARHEG